jgi:cellulose synthase/poly-beta-1,6-N-acetylglucosamine synthase-like glycosyltransferase
MSSPASTRQRVSVDGKFFRLGGRKFPVKGVTYGPLAPNEQGELFASPKQTKDDFKLLRELGANTLRLYRVPPRWFLDLAEEHALKLLVDVPWHKDACFLDSATGHQDARAAVRAAALACATHPAVLALSVVNEIPADIVRWSGPARIGAFLEELIDIVKSVDADCLGTFASFPPTEYLRAGNADFITFNVYLHQPRPFENYLHRLQSLAGEKPLLLGETGLDSLREGEEAQAATLEWQVESAFRCGLAGVMIYSFTDEWFKDGRLVPDWNFGLTTRNRVPKPAFERVQRAFAVAPHFPLPAQPRVSVVVASYNGARTLKTCLDSLSRLHYPDYEVILVDDGSTDATPQIASLYPHVRTIRQSNQGLSAARNAGIRAATGEIVAFTDSDCRADEDWLYYLVSDLLRSKYTGMGGHNFLPPEDSAVAAAVMASPGGPAHVMLTDRLAEHVPGCNMAFYKWALQEIDGFDPVFRKAGDDVDVCWRLQQRGYRIGFSHAGFVWHYRRSTIRAYLKQQQGYGEAEALLVRKHPEYFNALGGSVWHGRIYTPARIGLELRPPIIYHGPFCTGLFQSLYGAPPSMALMLLTSLQFHVLVTLPLAVLSVVFPFLAPLAITSAAVSLLCCLAAGWQADIPRRHRRWWSRPLVALLYFLQPIMRTAARYQSSLRLSQSPPAARRRADALADTGDPTARAYWHAGWFDRREFLQRAIERLDREGWQNKCDSGWNDYDLEVSISRWVELHLTTAAEYTAGGTTIRCRLRPAWSLLARIAFWSALGFELLIVGFTARATNNWMWLLLLTLIGFAAFLRAEQRHVCRLFSGFLDDLARQLGMIPLPPPAPPTAPTATAGRGVDDPFASGAAGAPGTRRSEA